MHRIDSATKAPDLFGAGKDGWKDGNKALGILATDLTAAFFNDLQENLAGLIETAGLALAKGDNAQLVTALIKKGFQEHLFNIAVAGGTANAITAAATPTITSLVDGMEVEVYCAAPNTSTTPTLKADGTVVTSIVKGNNLPLVANDILPGWNRLKYDATIGKWVHQHPAKGIVPAQGLYPGTPLMWPTPSCPAWALVRDGSAVSRAAYAALFGALCPTRSGTTANGSNAVTGLSTTTDLYVGMPVEAAGVAAGVTIASITSATAITISSNAIASGTVPITLFYYGYGAGGGATTFGVPDDRGVGERGLDTGVKGYDKSAITGTTVSGSNAITGLSSTVGLFVGQAVAGTGVPGGATVESITSATAIKISSNATASGTTVLTVTGRQIGSYEDDAMQGHWHSTSYYYGDGAGVGGSGIYDQASIPNPGNVTGSPRAKNAVTDGVNGNPRVGPETRGKNRAYLPIIVY